MKYACRGGPVWPPVNIAVSSCISGYKLTEKLHFFILQTKSHTPHTADCAASLAVENAICKLNPPV